MGDHTINVFLTAMTILYIRFLTDVLHFPAALAGALAIPFCFALLRQFGYSLRSATIGAALLAASPIYLQVSQEARPYPHLLLLFAASSWLATGPV